MRASRERRLRWSSRSFRTSCAAAPFQPLRAAARPFGRSGSPPATLRTLPPIHDCDTPLAEPPQPPHVPCRASPFIGAPVCPLPNTARAPHRASSVFSSGRANRSKTQAPKHSHVPQSRRHPRTAPCPKHWMARNGSGAALSGFDIVSRNHKPVPAAEPVCIGDFDWALLTAPRAKWGHLFLIHRTASCGSCGLLDSPPSSIDVPRSPRCERCASPERSAATALIETHSGRGRSPGALHWTQ